MLKKLSIIFLSVLFPLMQENKENKGVIRINLFILLIYKLVQYTDNPSSIDFRKLFNFKEAEN